MATRRSTRLKDGQPIGNIDEAEAQGRNQAFQEQRIAREAKHAGVTRKFDLFDLVPELRERVFYYAMGLDTPRQLGHLHLKLPTLALVSKQVRAEVLPIFFGKGHFVVDLHSNYIDMRRLDSMALPPGSKPSSNTVLGITHKYCGRISAGTFTEASPRRLLTELRKRDGFVACLRNIDMRIEKFGGPYDPVKLSLRIPTASKPRPTIEGELPATAIKYQRELDTLRERAVAKARKIAESREVFTGLTLEDLEAVIKEFAYWPV
ncbi:hypothetical protein LTR27_011878 [Elasticomyces elasticus]|nr:hypothetical protein LTR27_011878 [Elasticomyces elasticus]